MSGVMCGSALTSYKRYGALAISTWTSALFRLRFPTVSLVFFIVYFKWVYTLTPEAPLRRIRRRLRPRRSRLLPGIGHAVDAVTTLSAPTVPASGAEGTSGRER